MEAKNSSNEPKLDKPGAGIPFFQRQVLRWYIGPFHAARSDWAQDDANFQKLNAKILKVIDGVPSDLLEKRVLVPPQEGLEDSSRYWSAAMVLEHLMIVGGHIRDAVVELSQGHCPEWKADTALVKPMGKTDAAKVVVEFRRFSETIVEDLNARVKDRGSRTKHRHPWFGPFTAHQWHWLLAGHAHVHYLQLKRIAAGLF